MITVMNLTEAFWKIHEGLPRQSPGSDAATRNMLRLAGGATKFKNALDIGCGPGRASLILAEQGIKVTAIDLSDNFLTRLRESAKEKNLSNIEAIKSDMNSL